MTAAASTTVRGRLAPSPTGKLHLGNAYAFLTAWLSVRSQGGALILRMEDIDPERSRPDFAREIQGDLAWLGLTWDEGPDMGGPYGPYVQSLRLEGYAAHLDAFARRGLVYPCYCSRRELRLLASAPHIGDEGAPYPGACRALSAAARQAHEAAGKKPALRLNTDMALKTLGARADCGQALRFDEAVSDSQAPLRILGGDFALRRSDGVIAYQLAVVADDAAMAVSEVVRGEDLLASTPRQVLLFRLLGAVPPAYAHLPLLHDAAGERLAKRHKALEIAALREQGLSPAAVTGYLAYLAGWLDSPRPACPAELVSAFSLAPLAGRRLQLPQDPVQAIADL